MSTHVKSFMYIFCIIMLTTNIELGDNCVQIFNLWEVYRWIYGRKFSFTATRERSRKT